MTPIKPLDGVIPKVLHLTLHRLWFDAIAKGEKREEFRVIKPYWTKRFISNGEPIKYDEIHFKNGYAKDAPFMRVEWQGLVETISNPFSEGHKAYSIELGKILEIKNWPPKENER